MFSALIVGLVAANCIVSTVALATVVGIRRDAVSRARRIAMLTVEREMRPWLHKQDFRLDLLEAIEFRRSGPRLAEGTVRDAEVG